MADNVHDLRAHLFETLKAVKSGAMDLDRARAVNEISKTIIDTARVEVDFIKTQKEGDSEFLRPPEAPALPEPGNGIVGIVRHQLKG